jgi:formamidopyrimidine-DNA glycosylase
MPELPDVEGFRRFIAKHAVGREVTGVGVLDPVLVRNASPQSFEEALRGQRFESPRRHGKWLMAPVGDVEVLMHFGMTGTLTWSESGSERHRHDRIVFICGHRELRYNNMRRFGGVWLAHNPGERSAVTGPLGPDATSLTERQFEDLLAGRRGSLKAALMDQRLIAGLGNLMSDEIAWRARMHPAAPVSRLSRRRRQRVYEELSAVVSESTRYGRVPHGQRWLTRVRDDRHASCPRCGTPLRWATIAGRTACWCPRCQR